MEALPLELWHCVFDWVDTWGLAQVGRVCRDFELLSRQQLKRRRKIFAARVAAGEVRWKYVPCKGSPAPGLQLEDLTPGDEDENLRDYFAHSLALVYRNATNDSFLGGPLLARYGGSFHAGGNVFDMIFSPALYMYNFDKETWQRADSERNGQWAPSRRSFASMHVINNGNQLLFFGGQFRNRFALPLEGHPEGWKFFNDSFIFDLRTLQWSSLNCKGQLPEKRVGHRSIVIGRKMWMFGGTYLDNDFTYHYFNDLWSLDLETWTWEKHTAYGDIPTARQSHSLCRIPDTHRAILFGGNSDVLTSRQDLNDCYILDTDTLTWTRLEPTNRCADTIPRGRWCHSAFVIGDNMVVFGGFSRSSEPSLNIRTLWVLKIKECRWQKLDIKLHPSSLPSSTAEQKAQVLDRRVSFHAAALGLEQIYLFGGTKDHGLFILE